MQSSHACQWLFWTSCSAHSDRFGAELDSTEENNDRCVQESAGLFKPPTLAANDNAAFVDDREAA
jgi:peptidoglycan/xylan/chitin deacetylase (PgdA/CDA1 family)